VSPRPGRPSKGFPGHHPDGLHDDRPVHLRASEPAVGKGDGDLDDLCSQPAGGKGRLDLEGVALGVATRDERFEEKSRSKGPEAGGGIANWEVKRHSGVQVGEARQHAPVEPPVGDRSTLDIPRANDEVGTVVDRREQQAEVFRIVRQVRVHLDDDGEAGIECPCKSIAVGAAEAELARPVQYVHAVVSGCQSIREISCSIGAGVVDDQDIGWRRR